MHQSPAVISQYRDNGEIDKLVEQVLNWKRWQTADLNKILSIYRIYLPVINNTEVVFSYKIHDAIVIRLLRDPKLLSPM